jgi:hypothetical protein
MPSGTLEKVVARDCVQAVIYAYAGPSPQAARQAETTRRAESNDRRRRTRASFYRSQTWSAMRPRIGLAT